ncbi:half-sized ABC transporter [Trichoderma austrokoningii]
MVVPEASEGAVLVALKYLYPATVFVYFLVASLLASCTLQALKKNQRARLERPSQRAASIILACFLSTYVAQLIILGTQSVITRSAPIEHVLINNLSCILVFGILFIQLVESEAVVWYPFRGSWLLALCFELSIAILTALHLKGMVLGLFDILHMTSLSLRLVSLFTLVAWTCIGLWSGVPSVLDEERQALLSQQNGNQSQTQTNSGEPGSSSGYGSTAQSQGASDSSNTENPWQKRRREGLRDLEKRLEEEGSWIEYVKGFLILLPYIWPTGSRNLQLRAVAVILCLLASNALHLLIPRQTGIIMDTLGQSSSNPWAAVMFFALLRLAASESGIELVRSWLWIPVRYYSQEALTRASYSHIMHLSADFHESKSPSDLHTAIMGGNAIAGAIESILLSAAPMLVDMCVAVVYLSATFGAYEGLITAATGTVFMMLAARLVAESQAASRARQDAWFKENGIRTSGLSTWHTASDFNQIGYEDNRHANAVADRWLKEQQFMLRWSVSVAFQTTVLTVGLMASAFLAVFRIHNGQATPGQFAMLLMYWAQLSAPLQFFANLGKNMSDNFINAERLLAIMKTKPSVESKKKARLFNFISGEVKFQDVCFSYDGSRDIIDSVSLDIPAGMTVAFVGKTGSGKSTLLKLLTRSYDIQSGCISIDGQDIRDVELFSLREHIGVVHQSPELFDDTIMNNVRYSKLGATDEEVFEACQAAGIHDKILSYTDGYNTQVGERGVKISGGELQRLAIARAILKQPDIVVLDEATSAVDTETEQHIQKSLVRLCQGRTTLVVAHRLSTVMNADRIVVVENGKIIEQGSHSDLIAADGRYALLWSKQSFWKPHDNVADDLDDENASASDACSERTTTETCELQDESQSSSVSGVSDGKLSATQKKCQKEVDSGIIHNTKSKSSDDTNGSS